MNIKEPFPSVYALVTLGFVLVAPCMSNTGVSSQQEDSLSCLGYTWEGGAFIYTSSMPVVPELPPRVLIVADEGGSPLIARDPEVHIPDQSPPEKIVSAELPEPALVVPTAPAESQTMLPPVSSFSVMTKRPADPGTSSVVPPASIITIRPGEPGSVPEDVPAQIPSPKIEPPETLPSGSIITVKPAEPPPSAVQPPRPVPPPQSIRVAEPEAPIPAPREPIVLPIKPLPEISAPTPPISLETKKEGVSYSRIVKAMVGQLVEIPFRGTGWVYLGEPGASQGISYDSRRLEKEGQNFIFRAETAGTYGLKFYKQDFIEDYIVNDYVQVIVSADPARAQPVGRGRVLAEPRWPPVPGETAPPPPEVITNPPEPQVPASIPPVNPTPPVLPVDYLQQAREAYTAGQFSQVLSLLDRFREQYPGGSDEAWWLYGQSFEAPGPSRDIRSAIDYYHRLLREYPQSPHGTGAQRRISYLERYYFSIQ